MNITFLGTRSISFQNADSLGMLLQSDDGSILLECGPFVPLQLSKFKFCIESLDAVFISHDHSDHGSGLPYFLFVNLMRRFLGYYKGGGNLKLIIPNNKNSYLLEYCKKTYPLIFNENDFIKITVLGTEANEGISITPNLSINTFQVDHTVDNWGIVCTSNGKKISYISDSVFNESFINSVSNSDVLICSVLGPSLRKEMSDKLKFMTAKDAAIIAKKANVKKLAMIHLFFDEDAEKCIDEATSIFKGDIIIPISGAKINV